MKKLLAVLAVMAMMVSMVPADCRADNLADTFADTITGKNDDCSTYANIEVLKQFNDVKCPLISKVLGTPDIQVGLGYKADIRRLNRDNSVEVITRIIY